jgi:hypothetical protein
LDIINFNRKWEKLKWAADRVIKISYVAKRDGKD